MVDFPGIHLPPQLGSGLRDWDECGGMMWSPILPHIDVETSRQIVRVDFESGSKILLLRGVPCQ